MNRTSQVIGFPQTIDQCEQQSDPVRNIDELAKRYQQVHVSFLRDTDPCPEKRTCATSDTTSLIP